VITVASGAPGGASGAVPPLPKCIARGVPVSSTAEQKRSQPSLTNDGSPSLCP
jgi:hypothetical protein